VELDKFLGSLKEQAMEEDDGESTEDAKGGKEKGKEKQADPPEDRPDNMGNSQHFSKSLAERICPLIDAFYLLCTRCLLPKKSSSLNDSNSSKESEPDRFSQFIDRHAMVGFTSGPKFVLLLCSK